MKRIIKISVTLALTACLVFSMAGCGQKDDALKTVKEKGVLTVVCDKDQDKTLKAFEADFAGEIAARLGVELEVVEVDTAEKVIYEALSGDEPSGDMIMSGCCPTGEIRENYLITNPYGENVSDPYVLVVSENNSKIKSFKGIKGKYAANTPGTEAGELANEFGANLIEATKKQAVMLIENGAADCMVISKSGYKTLKGDVKKVDEYVPEDPLEIQYAGVIKLENVSLCVAVNEQIDAIIADGTAYELAEEHFGSKYAGKVQIYK